MSKYEPRSKQMKEEVAPRGWRLSWTQRNYKIYLTVSLNPKFRDPELSDAFDSYYVVRSWVYKHYPQMELTSWNRMKGTFKVQDFVQILKS